VLFSPVTGVYDDLLEKTTGPCQAILDKEWQNYSESPSSLQQTLTSLLQGKHFKENWTVRGWEGWGWGGDHGRTLSNWSKHEVCFHAPNYWALNNIDRGQPAYIRQPSHVRWRLSLSSSCWLHWSSASATQLDSCSEITDVWFWWSHEKQVCYIMHRHH